MLMAKVQKDSKLFLDGKWSSRKYATEIVKNTLGASDISYVTVNGSSYAVVEKNSVASRPISKGAIRAKLCK